MRSRQRRDGHPERQDCHPERSEGSRHGSL